MVCWRHALGKDRGIREVTATAGAAGAAPPRITKTPNFEKKEGNPNSDTEKIHISLRKMSCIPNHKPKSLPPPQFIVMSMYQEGF